MIKPKRKRKPRKKAKKEVKKGLDLLGEINQEKEQILYLLNATEDLKIYDELINKLHNFQDLEKRLKTEIKIDLRSNR